MLGLALAFVGGFITALIIIAGTVILAALSLHEDDPTGRYPGAA